MDHLLTSRLPIELAEVIARQVHEMYMKEVIHEITHCIVWIRMKNQMPSFLIGRYRSNYYHALIDYDNIVGTKVIVL
jgi:tryptophan 2,3-dioxygenase